MAPPPNDTVSPPTTETGNLVYPEDQTVTRSSTSTPLLDPIVLRKIAAEFVGTFIIIFSAVAGSILDQKLNGVETLIGNAACAGTAVLLAVLTTGHISGAHLNPAVTVAFTAIRHFPLAQVPFYFVAQLGGSLSAVFLLKWAYNPFMSGGVTASAVGVAETFVLEFVATFFLMFVITAVATDTRAVGEMAGIAIATGASMNPVRTLGPAIATGNYRRVWIYMIAPVIGAVSGAFVYTNIKLEENSDAKSK
ncbi:hypothetical protein V2J09_014793 [Rumex salicifolius]